MLADEGKDFGGRFPWVCLQFTWPPLIVEPDSQNGLWDIAGWDASIPSNVHNRVAVSGEDNARELRLYAIEWR